LTCDAQLLPNRGGGYFAANVNRGTINPSRVYRRRRAPGTANADLAKLDLQALERETGFDVEMTRPWWRRLVRR